MLHTLNKIGKRVSTFFGEPPSYISENRSQNIFSGDPLANLLPWVAYDEEYGLFLSKNSIGFTIEAIPISGDNRIAVQKEIHSIFQEILEEGESLQCFLWADHRIEPFLRKWEGARHGAKEIYLQIAQKKIEHYLNTPNLSTRIFRFLLSYSSESSPEPVELEKLKNKREKILKTLHSFTYAFTWDVHQFLETTSALINYSPAREIHKRHWNLFQSLASQLPAGGELKIDEDHLRWEKESQIHLKTFRVS